MNKKKSKLIENRFKFQSNYCGDTKNSICGSHCGQIKKLSSHLCPFVYRGPREWLTDLSELGEYGTESCDNF